MQDNSAQVSAPNADTRAGDFEDWDWAPVCVAHLRFPPCRREGPCSLWNDDGARRIVSDYQQSKLSEAFARAALRQLPQYDGQRESHDA